MHPSDQQLPLWSYVCQLEHEALNEWRTEHHPSLTLEGAMAQYCRSVESTIVRKPGGAISVTIGILANRAFECEVRFHRLVRTANKLYRTVDPV